MSLIVHKLAIALSWLPLAVVVGAAGGDRAGRAESAGAMPITGEGQGALDAYINGRLTTAYLLSDQLKPFPIEVAVRDGNVTLQGQVGNRVQRDLAVEIARSVAEVREVDAQLEIEPVPPRRTAAVVQDNFVQRVTDAGITARIKTRLLWNVSTRGLAIDVRTSDNVVTLSGSVESLAEGILAELIAENTRGVRQVVNRLQIGTIPVPAVLVHGGTG